MAETRIVAQGSGSDPTALMAANDLLKNGEEVELRILIDQAPTAEQLQAFEADLIHHGIVLRDNIAYDSGLMVIRFVYQQADPQTIGAFLLPAVPWIVGGVVSLVGVVLAWQMTKSATSSLGSVLSNPLFIGSVIAFMLIIAIVKAGPKEVQR